MREQKGRRLLAAAAFALIAGLLAANNPAPRIEKDMDHEARACAHSIESAFDTIGHRIAA